MLKKKSLFTAVFLILTLLITALPASAAQKEVRVYVNDGQVFFPDQKPYIDGAGRTLVPVRFVSEALGGPSIGRTGTRE